MNGTLGFQEVRSSTPDHHRIASYRSGGIKPEQVSRTFFALTISSLTPQASAQRERRFLAHFSSSGKEHVFLLLSLGWSFKVDGAPSTQHLTCVW